MEVENKVRKIDKIYTNLCKDVLKGHRVDDLTELNNVMFVVKDITDCVIGVREISHSYICGELLWYFTADDSMNFIAKFSKMWSRISDNGRTSNSAYGDIIFQRYGFDQLEMVVALLKKNPGSKRAVINFNVPNVNKETTKDEICTIMLQFYVRDGRLNCTGVMRSNDLWKGLPYDIIFFTILQKYVADRLSLKYGTYTHFAVSLHVYDSDRELVERVAESTEEDNTRLIFTDESVLFDIRKMLEIYRTVDKSFEPRETVVREFVKNSIIKEVNREKL